jgi:3-methyladenine DNA glycosylase AlkD
MTTSAILESIKRDISRKGSLKKAKILSRFFKTGPGEYGEGDIFLGVTIPMLRSVVKGYIHGYLKDSEKYPEEKKKDELLSVAQALLRESIHEYRMAGLYVLVHLMNKSLKSDSSENKIFSKRIYMCYMNNLDRINNWDLVDSSAYQIVGAYLLHNKGPNKVLLKLSASKNIWERRVSIISTFAHIKVGIHEPTVLIAEKLLYDTHDLIHKAVGWMLREMGKRDKDKLKAFLSTYANKMPRTMLRYSIEKLSNKERVYFMSKI